MPLPPEAVAVCSAFCNSFNSFKKKVTEMYGQNNKEYNKSNIANQIP